MNLRTFTSNYLYKTDSEFESLLGMVVYYETCNSRGEVLGIGIGRVASVKCRDSTVSVQPLGLDNDSPFTVYARNSILYEHDILIPLWREENEST